MMQDAAVIDMRGHGVLYFDEKDSRIIMRNNSIFEMNMEGRIRVSGYKPNDSPPIGSGAILNDGRQIYLGRIPYGSNYHNWDAATTGWQNECSKDIVDYLANGYSQDGNRATYHKERY